MINFKLMYTPAYDVWHVLIYDGKHWMLSHTCLNKEEALLTVIQLNRTEDDGTI